MNMGGGYGVMGGGGYGMPPQGMMGVDPNGMMMMGPGGYPGPMPPPPQHSGPTPMVPVFAPMPMMRPGGMQAIVMPHPTMPFFSGPGPNGPHPSYYPMGMDGQQPQRFGMGQGYPQEGQGGYHPGGGGGGGGRRGRQEHSSPQVIEGQELSQEQHAGHEQAQSS